MATKQEQDVLAQIAASAVGPLLKADGPVRQFSFESAFCYRAIDGIGIQFTVDWREPYVFTLVWSPTESTCPIGYQNESGAEAKILMLDALRRLQVDTRSFKAAMLNLRGDIANIPAMIELSTKMLLEHLTTLNANVKTLFF
jgi:hypothetical protein